MRKLYIFNRYKKVFGLSLLASVLLTLTLGAATAMGQESEGVQSIMNFRQYSERFSSAGQPSREQFQSIKDAGFDRVVYIALDNTNGAIADEGSIVLSLGMEYVHIPVDFANPQVSEFEAFARAMNSDDTSNTLLHCQVNARATAFSFLYRVIYDGVSQEEAKQAMNTVWQPNGVWRDFIKDVLAAHGRSLDECPSCDWTPPVRPGN